MKRLSLCPRGTVEMDSGLIMWIIVAAGAAIGLSQAIVIALKINPEHEG